MANNLNFYYLLVIFTLHALVGSAQSKVESLYNSGNYSKCIQLADKNIEKEKDLHGSLFYKSLSLKKIAESTSNMRDLKNIIVDYLMALNQIKSKSKKDSSFLLSHQPQINELILFAESFTNKQLKDTTSNFSTPVLQQLIRFSPHNCNYRSALISAYLSKKQLPDALSALNDWKEKSKPNPIWQINIIELFLVSGQKETASDMATEFSQNLKQQFEDKPIENYLLEKFKKYYAVNDNITAQFFARLILNSATEYTLVNYERLKSTVAKSDSTELYTLQNYWKLVKNNSDFKTDTIKYLNQFRFIADSLDKINAYDQAIRFLDEVKKTFHTNKEISDYMKKLLEKLIGINYEKDSSQLDYLQECADFIIINSPLFKTNKTEPLISLIEKQFNFKNYYLCLELHQMMNDKYSGNKKFSSIQNKQIKVMEQKFSNCNTCNTEVVEYFIAGFSGKAYTNKYEINSKRWQMAMLQHVNELRKRGCKCGDEQMPPVEPLEWNDLLAQSALNHSKDMARNDNRSHTGSDGSNVVKRAERVGYFNSPIGENIASYASSIEEVVSAWQHSPGHCKAMMAKYFTQLGAARVGAYWTQNFGGF